MCRTCGCGHLNYDHEGTVKFKNSPTTKTMNLKEINAMPKVPKIAPMPRTTKKGK